MGKQTNKNQHAYNPTIANSIKRWYKKNQAASMNSAIPVYRQVNTWIGILGALLVISFSIFVLPLLIL